MIETSPASLKTLVHKFSVLLETSSSELTELETS
jgi:hypothetical protein